MIGDTLFCWPQKSDRQFLTPIVASLGFALSPLIIIWSRTAVSDALLTGTLGISLLLFWRRMASENNDQCISAWVFLGFAIFLNSIYGYFIYIKSTRILKDIFYTWPCIIFYTHNELFN